MVWGVGAVDATFTEAKIDEMVDVLKERGIFRFLTRYITEERIPIANLLLIFGTRVVSVCDGAPPHTLYRNGLPS